MKRTALKDRELPDYSKVEETFNSVSHMLGVVLGIVATILCVVGAARAGNVWGIVGSAIFGFNMILLYTVSAVYHGLNRELKAKKVMQVIDHCTIFLLIAGTYTPICLCAIREFDPALCWTIFGIVWGAALVGITLNSIDLKRYKAFSMVCYLAMGWCVILTARDIDSIFSHEEFMLILAGGIAYTLGAVLYLVGAKKPVMHSVFHVLTVIGSLLHFLAVFLMVR